MSQNTSFVPPDFIPPLPPVVKVIMLAFSALMTLALIALIGFIIVEFTADMAGHPLGFIRLDQMREESLFAEQDEEGLKSPFELITPKHQTQMFGPEIVVIYTVRSMPTATPDLRVNDVPYPWEVQYGDNTWFARLQLPEGSHYLRAGEAEAEFVVVSADSTDSTHLLSEFWYHDPHPGTNEINRCADCHEMSDQMTNLAEIPRGGTIGIWKGVSSCYVCHDEEKHTITHRSILPMTGQQPRCVRCHAIH